MNAKALQVALVSFLAVIWSSAQPQPGTILWIYDCGSQFSPAVAPDGTIYLTGTGLHAVTNAGTFASNKWSFAADITSSPAIGDDGTIYCGGYRGFYAVNPNGTLKWLYPLSRQAGSPAMAFDRTIYFQSEEYLYALTEAGTLKWKSAMTFLGSYSAPTIGLDGTIYVGSSDEPNLYAFNADGTQKWVRELESPCGGSPAVGLDGTVYITGGYLYAFTPDGMKLWNSGYFFGASPTVAKEGMIYIALKDFPGPLYRVSPSGVPLLTDATEKIRYTTPKCAAIDVGGTVWYCASNMVWALDAEGHALPWSQVIDDGYWSPETSPVIGPDGTLFFTRGSRLYAIATGTKGPADSAWPMYRGNFRHTGKVEKPSLLNSQRRKDANFEFQLYSQLGQTNTLETTTNLSTWSFLTSVVVTNVPMDVLDLTASNAPSRFYRAIAP